MTEQQPTTNHHVASWQEANELVKEITKGGTRALGSGSSYPEDFTLNYMDSWSGEGTGYRIWKNEDGKHKEIIGFINIGRRMSDRTDPESQLPMFSEPEYTPEPEKIPDYWLRFTYQGDDGEEFVSELGCSSDMLYEKISEMRTQGYRILDEEILAANFDESGNLDGWGDVDVEDFPDYL